MSTPTQEADEPPSIGAAQSDGIVIVEIGTEPRKYYLHRSLLAHHSEYFDKALRGSWKEVQEGVVRIDDIEPAEFIVFAHWLYAQQLPDGVDYSSWDRVMELSGIEPAATTTLTLIKAYALADKLLAAVFRRAVNNVIIEGSLLIDPTHITDALPVYKWAFSHIPAERIVLQYLVDDFCYGWSVDDDQDDVALNELPPGCAARLLRAVAIKHSAVYETE